MKLGKILISIILCLIGLILAFQVQSVSYCEQESNNITPGCGIGYENGTCTPLCKDTNQWHYLENYTDDNFDTYAYVAGGGNSCEYNCTWNIPPSALSSSYNFRIKSSFFNGNLTVPEECTNTANTTIEMQIYGDAYPSHAVYCFNRTTGSKVELYRNAGVGDIYFYDSSMYWATADPDIKYIPIKIYDKKLSLSEKKIQLYS